MPVTKDTNGHVIRTRLEAGFWVKLAGLMIGIFSTVWVGFSWYVDDQISDAIAQHREEASAAMQEKVDMWWGKQVSSMARQWRAEIRTAMLEHLSISPAHEQSKINTARLNAIENRMRRLETNQERMLAHQAAMIGNQKAIITEVEVCTQDDDNGR